MNRALSRKTSVSFGNYFENFFDNTVINERFINASEVIRAGLRLFEEDENELITLKNAINEGLESEIAINFNHQMLLEKLKAKKYPQISLIYGFFKYFKTKL